MQLLSPERIMVPAQAYSGSPQMNDQADLNPLLDLPKLPLSLIWQRICQLPMRDRCALLATCKCARGTFSEITDTMDRLQLLFGEGFIQGLTDHIEGKLSLGGGARVSDQAPQQEGHSRVPAWAHALKVLSWFPHTTIGRLELSFASAGSRQMLQSFTAAAACQLRLMTALELNGPHIEVRKFHAIQI